MAKPITEIKHASQEEPADNLILQASRLNFGEYLDSIEEFLKLLKSLKDSGLLSMISAFSEHYRDSTDVVVEQLANEKNYRVVRNILTLYTLLSNIDPDHLRSIAENAGKELTASRTSESIREPLGALQLLRLLKDPETSAGVRVMFSLLKAFAPKSGD